MILRLERIRQTPERTFGRLYVNGVFECYTLEDTVRTGAKVAGKTAIPVGTYQVSLTESFRFKRVLPLLVDVPNFTGVRMHPGNTEHDTEGCILTGDVILVDRRGGSRRAFERLFAKMEKAAKTEKISIEILNL